MLDTLLSFFLVKDASDFAVPAFLRQFAHDVNALPAPDLMPLWLAGVLALIVAGLLVLISIPALKRGIGEDNASLGRGLLTALLFGLGLYSAWVAVPGNIFPLYIFVPIAASVVVALICILSRKFVQRMITEGLAQFFQGLLTALMLALAIYATCNYFDFGKWRYSSFFNAYEFYHYYIGSKYAEEVGYNNMYYASLIADDETQENGLKYNNAEGRIRDLDTGRHVPFKPVLEDPEKYRSLFSPLRWEEFKKDIDFFKSELTTGRWSSILRDKGYNATPVWTTVVGGVFSNNVDSANRTHMVMLAMLDLVLIALAFGFVCWAFGLRAGLLMIILLGTSYVMKYSHMKGAYLRTDFAMSLILSICLVKKHHYKTAGALAAYSVFSRIFPAVFLFGLGAKMVWDLVPHLRALLRRAKLAPTAVFIVFGVLVAAWVAFFIFGPSPILIEETTPGGRDYLTLNTQPVFELSASDSRLAGLLLRPIPVFVAVIVPVAIAGAAFAVTFLWAFWRRRLQTRYLSFFLSAAATSLILTGASVAYIGVDYWQEYAEKIGQHNDDISPWRVGFKYLFIGFFSTGQKIEVGVSEPTRLEQAMAVAKAAMQEEGRTLADTVQKRATFFFKELKVATRSVYYREHQALFWTICGLVLLIGFFCVYGLKDHEAFAWSFVPVYFLVSPTYYYFIMLLIPLLFFSPYIDRPFRALGCIFLLLSATAGYPLYGELGYRQQFPTYYWHSVLFGLIVIYMMLVAAGTSLRAAFSSGQPREFDDKRNYFHPDERTDFERPRHTPPANVSPDLEPLETGRPIAAPSVEIEPAAPAGTTLEIDRTGETLPPPIQDSEEPPAGDTALEIERGPEQGETRENPGDLR